MVIVEMYRPSQYKSWGEARELGGVHYTIAKNNAEVDSVRRAVYNTARCIGGEDDIRTRVAEGLPFGLAEFYAAFDSSFGYNIPLCQVCDAILNDNNCSEYTAIRDAWNMWWMAVEYAKQK